MIMTDRENNIKGGKIDHALTLGLKLAITFIIRESDDYFLNEWIVFSKTSRKKVRYTHYNFPEPKETYLNVLFCLQSKDFQCANIEYDKEKPQLTFLLEKS